MKTTIKKTFLGILFFFNICCILFLLLSDLAPWVDAAKYWPIALSGILFPLLFSATLIYFVFWLLVKPRRSIISFISLLCSLPALFSTVAFNYPAKFIQTKQPGHIRLVSWNVALMSYTETDSLIAIKNNAVIFKKLRETDADVICLQEFFTAISPGNHYNLMDSIARTLHYPYHYFSMDNPKFDKKFYDGSIIFSRYKIVDTQKTIFPTAFTGSVIKTGILVNNDTIDIFTSRLQSVKFKSQEYQDMNAIKTGKDSAFKGSKNILQKLRAGYSQRVAQVYTIKKTLHESKRPLIFTADLNDVPVSFTYTFLKKNLSDTWIKKGSGIGKTFKYLSPTLRIDQIFYNQFFKAIQVKRIFSAGESDHYGLVADFLPIKKEQ
jgi:endonuclease/exonuclease/phosphatase family metal-dependent hydrolase